MKEAAAIQFAMDAFGHLKAIGYSDEAMPLLQKAGVTKDEGVAKAGDVFMRIAGRRFYDREPSVRNLA